MTTCNRDRLIWLIVAIIVCAMLSMVLLDMVGARQSTSQPITCMAPDLRDKMRALSLDAIDEAYQDRVKRVFEIWMADPKDQPNRAAVGARNAIRAWANSRRFIETWNPPPCP